MKKSQENAMKGCTTSSVVRSGNSYTFTATCNVQGVTMSSKSVITAELLVAKRTGDC